MHSTTGTGVEPLLGGTGGGASGAGAAGGRYRTAQSAAAQPPAAAGGPEPAGRGGTAPAGERPPDRAGVHGGEQPGFVLAYLNASQNGVHLLAVPAGLQVTFADEDAALADCYAAAGPARCRQALMECLPLPEDTRYRRCRRPYWSASRPGTGRCGWVFRGDDRRGAGPLWPRQPGAGTFGGRSPRLSDRNGRGRRCAAGPPGRGAGAVWDAFFRQNLDLLPGALPQALRSVSASLLTDLTALDLDTLDRTLEFLANNEAQIETQVLPGDEQAGRYTLNEESLAAVQSFFNVSPTDGQASSASEP